MTLYQTSSTSHPLILPNGNNIILKQRLSNRARHIILRIDYSTNMVELVLPPGTALNEGLRFAYSKTDWIQKKLEQIPTRILFKPGVILPVRGRPLKLVKGVKNSENPIYIDDRLIICSENNNFANIVHEWLIAEARKEINSRAIEYSKKISYQHIANIAIKDTKTRWGSCSTKGRLSFSWRLILAPPNVLNYVVAHEISHLRQMNHSKAFWLIVSDLVGDYKEARIWLNSNSIMLRSFGHPQ